MKAIDSENQEILLETGTNELEIAEFNILLKDSDSKKQSFGINVAKIREIIKMPNYIKMPQSDENIFGIFKLRDKVIPLIDLARWLNEKTDDLDYTKCFVIVAEFNQSIFGFMIHGIQTIHRISWNKILPPTNISSDMKANCITGVINFEDKIMMMLDFEKIVSDITPELSLRVSSDKELLDEAQKIRLMGKPKILLAEDSSVVRDLLTQILEKGGFEVVSVNNGALAWEYINAFSSEAKSSNKPLNEIVQLLITDIEMPQMDGHTLCRKVKETSELKTLPVVLFSSLIYEEIRRKGDLIGADAQISKPELGNLINIVRSLIKKQEKPAS